MEEQTRGFGQGHDNCYTIIHGTYESAREEMARRYGKSGVFNTRQRKPQELRALISRRLSNVNY